MENKQKNMRPDPTMFTARCPLAPTSETNYAYVDLLCGKGLYELCHSLVGLATARFGGMLERDKRTAFHASFRVKHAPVIGERVPFMS